MTLDRYADLFDDDLDDVADRQDPRRLAALQDRGAESAGQKPIVGVETRGIEPLTPALQNRPRGGLAQWAVTENPS
jgi:hypothetical protein